MKTLTKEQVELLANPDVKAIAEQYLQYLINNCDSKIPFDSFASQFTVEPEWKILKSVNKDKDCSVEPHDYSPLCDAECTPHSVQYKSEILTVGDDTNKGKIVGFRITGNDLLVNCVVDIRVDNVWDISEVKKIERKLRFVTNGDGEEIFDGEVVYFITTHNEIKYWMIDKNFVPLTTSTYFKSKEKATEYVLLNSPKLSVKEVMKVYNDSYDTDDLNQIKKDLIKLVKSKQ